MPDRTMSPETPVDHLTTRDGYDRWAEFYDADAIQYSLSWLREHPGDAGWGFYYFIERAPAGARSLLVGSIICF